MDFEPCFKVYNLVPIRPKSTKLGQMTTLDVIFHIVGSLYRLVIIRNSPQFPVEFRNGLLFIFFSARERAELNKSCNLIGSSSGRNFLIRTATAGGIRRVDVFVNELAVTVNLSPSLHFHQRKFISIHL